MCFSRKWTTNDLAEKWRGEQLKMLGGGVAKFAHKNGHITKQPPLYSGEDKTLGGSKELFPRDFPLVSATTLIVNQVVQGSSPGDKDSKLGWKPCNQ